MKKRFIAFMGLSKGIALVALLMLTLALVFGNASHVNANGVLLDREWLPVEPALGGEGTETSVQVEQQGSIYVEPTISFTFAGTWIDELEIDHEKFQQLRVPGCGATGEVGQPEMPFKGIFLEIPYGVEVEVQILGQETLSLGTGYSVYPVQEPMPDLEGAPEPPFAFDAKAYAADRFFPESPIEVEAPAFIREKRVVFVKIFPMTYNPAMGELIGYKKLSFRLVWRGEIDPSGIKEKQRLRSRFFKPLPNELLANYTLEASPEVDALNDAAANRISTPVDNETEDTPESELSTTTAADYLIIVYDTFADEILPLANWKNKMGYVTRVVNMSTVGTTYSHVMTYIQNAYNTWTPAPSFVLLVGDYNQVPPHSANVFHSYHGTSTWPSDHNYACTSGTDYFADLAIGRLSVGTEAECTTVVNKILEYERTPDSGTWWDDALIAALFQDRDGLYTVKDGTADRWFMETATHILDYLNVTVGYDIETAQCTDYWPLEYTIFHYRSSSYPNRPTPPDPVPTAVVNRWTSASQSTTDITTAINGGVGVVVHRDHGGYTSWGHPPYSVSNVNALTNGDMTPVVFSINCLTGGFDYSSGDCFAEAFQKKNGGGASGIVAASRVSYSGYNDLLAHGIFTSFWPGYDSSYTNTTYPNSWRVAEALNFAKYYMYTYEGSGTTTEVEFKLFHCFGDPSMMMRTVNPQSLTVSHASTIAQNATSFTVNVTQVGALVALEQDGNVLGTAISSGGSATVSISSSLSTSTVYVTVTNHDYLPYEGTASVTSGTTGILWDNGPLVNSPGTGAGGADESMLQTALSMNTLGWGHQVYYGYRIADDFTVSGAGWQIGSITFFAYQTDSTTTSTLTQVNYNIWDGPPDNPASNIVFSQTVPLTPGVNTVWSNIYRVTDYDSGNTQRPIMANTVNPGIFLSPGTYWLDWQTDGTLPSGPWAPPITINGQTTTGNALQFTTSWAAVLDSGTSTQQGFPFIIRGPSLNMGAIYLLLLGD